MSLPTALAVVLVGAAVPLAASASSPGAATGAESFAAGYTTYVACSTKKSAEPDHKCKRSQPKTAFFKSADADVQYKICVKYPGRPEPLCATHQQADQGEKRKNAITSTILGRHKVKWYVGGEKVGAFSFRVVAD